MDLQLKFALLLNALSLLIMSAFLYANFSYKDATVSMPVAFDQSMQRKASGFLDPRTINTGGHLVPMEKMAEIIIQETDSGGLVSDARKKITVKLSISVLMDGVDGDFVEAGVYNGGTSILMGKVLNQFDTSGNRVLWSADSFKGFPDEDQKSVDEAGSIKTATIGQLNTAYESDGKGAYASSLQVFKDNIQNTGLQKFYESGHLKILEGFYADTLPHADIRTISFLRLDGDIFISTWQSLEYLYDKLKIGGYIYIDDYGSYEGCNKAVNKYRKLHNISDIMIPVYEEGDKFEAVWWRKTS